MQPPFPEKLHSDAELRTSSDLRRVVNRIHTTLERDSLVRQVTTDLQHKLEVDRVLLYYFYRQWKGRVTFEVLSDPKFSIFGSTGPDECFNDEYAALYFAGRVRAIADIETEPIADCHRDFLRGLGVRANLVVPVLIPNGLWGLLVAHHCQSVRPWAKTDIAAMQQGAETLAIAPSVRGRAEA
ncbi:MAG: GAF domain-containing protein [Nodosilinea sp.]